MSKEERKKLAQARKAVREANKERYGYATLDGVRVEINNYMVELSSIFMGRGERPSVEGGRAAQRRATSP